MAGLRWLSAGEPSIHFIKWCVRIHRNLLKTGDTEQWKNLPRWPNESPQWPKESGVFEKAKESFWRLGSFLKVRKEMRRTSTQKKTSAGNVPSRKRGAGDEHTETCPAFYRICLVSDFFHPNTGGVETHIYQLAQCLLQRGHSVVVLTHSYRDRIGIRYLTNGLKVIHLPLWSVYCESGLPTLFCPAKLIRNVLIRERVQIVHSHGAFSSLALETLIHAACLGKLTFNRSKQETNE